MALVDSTWYANSVAYAAVPAFAISTAYTAGQLVRQLATPTVGNERVFICIVAGTSAGSEPSWTLTRGAKTVSNTATFQECTGQAALNGDLTNTQTWAAVKAATPAVLGQIIKRSSGASYQICTTAGAMSASEPAFSDTAGVTTTDTTAVWTSLGAVGSYTGGMAPFARLASASAGTWFAAGNTIFVSSNHAETQATAITINMAGSITTVGKVLCHNVSGSYPPASGDLTTGATITVTGNVSIFFTPSVGTYYFYGLTFKVAIGQTGTQNMTFNIADCWMQCDRCSFELASTGSSSRVLVSGSSSTCIFNNSTVKFASVGHMVSLTSGQFLWQNTGQVLVSGSLVPTSLVMVASGSGTVATLEALDLSQLTGNIIAPGIIGYSTIRDCKLHASTTVPTPTSFGAVSQLSRSSA